MDDLKYRKLLINIFVNSIFLYDDRLTMIFNSGDMPVTVDDKLLSEIEADNKVKSSSLSDVAPPQIRPHHQTICSNNRLGYAVFLNL